MIWSEYYRRLPRTLRQHLAEPWIARLPDSACGKRRIDRLKRFVAAADIDPYGRYTAFLTIFSADEQRQLLVPGFINRNQPNATDTLKTLLASPDADCLPHQMMLADLRLYLPGDLLALSDRVSMAHSLEVRVPFLDHPLLELMARMPAHYKISKWTKKILFKKAFAGMLPKNILHRKKVGFSIPLALWLRTDLKPMMRELLCREEINNIGYLNFAAVNNLMGEHLAAKANHENKLWALINLVSWHRSIHNVSIPTQI